MKINVIMMSVLLPSMILSKSTPQYILLEYAFMRSKLLVNKTVRYNNFIIFNNYDIILYFYSEMCKKRTVETCVCLIYFTSKAVLTATNMERAGEGD